MATEMEFSFCFPYSSSNDNIRQVFKSGIFKNVTFKHSTSYAITDRYLSKDTRIRRTNTELYLYRKSGDKAFKREEDVTELSSKACNILRDKIKLLIRKDREIYKFQNLPADLEGEEIYLMIDTIQYPMKVKMAEVECSEKVFTFLSQLNSGFMSLKRNIKPAWDYFHRKIGFIGAPSCGKSTMTRKLCNRLSIDYGVPTEQIAEYARTHIARYGVPNWYLQPLIEWGQERRERDAQHSIIIVTDSPRFLPYIYCVYNHNEPLTEDAIYVMSKMYKDALYATHYYSDIILLAPQPNKTDGIRYHSDADNYAIHNYIEMFFKQHNVPHIKCDYTKDPKDLILEMFNINTIPEITKEVVIEPPVEQGEEEDTGAWYD